MDIEENAEFHREFWNEIQEDIPNIQIMQNLGTKITENNEKIKKLFKYLMEIYPNNIKCQTLYGKYLK